MSKVARDWASRTEHRQPASSRLAEKEKKYLSTRRRTANSHGTFKHRTISLLQSMTPLTQDDIVLFPGRLFSHAVHTLTIGCTEN